MLDLLTTIRGQVPELDPALIEMHCRRLPISYFERFSPADIGRHLRLLNGLGNAHVVDVEVRPLTSQAFEVTVVGLDFSGTLACITAALAAHGFDLEDVQVSPYLDPPASPAGATEPSYFVIVLRVSGSLGRMALPELVGKLRDRLRLAFGYLAQGNLRDAQTIAADPLASPDSGGSNPDRRSTAASARQPAGYEGRILGGDFRVERKLATGGMSDVYLATQTSLNRTVALKIIRQEGPADSEYLARINNEAQVLAQFSCAQIVPILAAGTAPDPSGGTLGWMAMEYMAGGDLDRWLQEKGSPEVERALRWFREALEGLLYAHRHAILHRDLKPHNLLLTSEGHLKVSDFGLLKQSQGSLEELPSRGGIVGTPQYMSPEQAMGGPLDERSDIFSLGTTFFYILSGQLPFQKSTPAGVLMQITHEDAPKLAAVAPHVPVPLSVIIGRMMARSREERYQDVSVILEDLASYERRGLLGTSPSGSILPVPSAPLERPEVETQAYQPAAERMDDL